MVEVKLKSSTLFGIVIVLLLSQFFLFHIDALNLVLLFIYVCSMTCPLCTALVFVCESGRHKHSHLPFSKFSKRFHASTSQNLWSHYPYNKGYQNTITPHLGCLQTPTHTILHMTRMPTLFLSFFLFLSLSHARTNATVRKLHEKLLWWRHYLSFFFGAEETNVFSFIFVGGG